MECPKCGGACELFERGYLERSGWYCPKCMVLYGCGKVYKSVEARRRSDDKVSGD